MSVNNVYCFGGSADDCGHAGRELLGDKGATLAELDAAGLPVPPGFIISTEACRAILSDGGRLPADLITQIGAGLSHIEALTNSQFGNPARPLIVSVRSGAAVSMPGMMDTILNLGLNDATVEGLAELSGNLPFAWDCYRRFIQNFAEIALEQDPDDIAEMLNAPKANWGKAVPQSVMEQLHRAIIAVCASSTSARAALYRSLNGLPDHLGTAITVQAMVFGNKGDSSASGVAFTRDPATGEKALYGEYLLNAQGEDIVSGICTPLHLTRAAREQAGTISPSLEEAMPDLFRQLEQHMAKIETRYRDLQDVEFTVEAGTFWILQSRAGKRTTQAALKIAVDLANEGLISRAEAIARIDPALLEQLALPRLDPHTRHEILTMGLPASPGVASGKLIFDSASAILSISRGEATILVRAETSPDDIQGIHAATGILTARGGATSHAATVARAMGRPCVCGASELLINLTAKTLSVAGHIFHEGDDISIDGSTGKVIAGKAATIQPLPNGEHATMLQWIDAARMA